jgi:hypothetical protein
MIARSRSLLAVALVLALAAGVSGCFNPFRPLVSGLTSFVKPPPSPTNAKELVTLFKWCWENRDISHYKELFTYDYRFAFSITDTAGNPYRGTPWTREDEITSATNLFAGGAAGEPAASSITLIFDGNLTPQNDLRQGKTAKWHQQIQISNLTLTITKTDGSAVRVTGGALFYMVRGDSAVIPPELIDIGFHPDSSRWYIERWEDQTNTGGGGAALAPATGERLAAPAELPLPMSWGLVKRVWLKP